MQRAQPRQPRYSLAPREPCGQWCTLRQCDTTTRSAWGAASPLKSSRCGQTLPACSWARYAEHVAAWGDAAVLRRSAECSRGCGLHCVSLETRALSTNDIDAAVAMRSCSDLDYGSQL